MDTISTMKLVIVIHVMAAMVLVNILEIFLEDKPTNYNPIKCKNIYD